MNLSSVLYVTDTRYGQNAWNDPSARHRCYHYADALVADSWISRVVHIDRLSELLVRQFRHVIFHRPKFTGRFAKAIELCRRCDVVLHADYDDLIFDTALASSSPLYINGNRPLDKVEAYFSDNRQAMQCFESIVVSTGALAKHVLSSRPQMSVTILPNSLPRLFQAPQKRAVSNKRFTIGYFPGSNSHSHDVEMIRGALAGLFTAMPDSKLVVMGRMEPESLPFSSQQVTFKSFVDYSQYLEQLAQVDLSIAPLQANVFNDAKSAVKLIESVSVGTPILATENGDMRDHQNPMSLLVKDEADWPAMLLHCANDQSGFDNSSSERLKQSYSVQARLPVLQKMLSAAA